MSARLDSALLVTLAAGVLSAACPPASAQLAEVCTVQHPPGDTSDGTPGGTPSRTPSMDYWQLQCTPTASPSEAHAYPLFKLQNAPEFTLCGKPLPNPGPAAPIDAASLLKLLPSLGGSDYTITNSGPWVFLVSNVAKPAAAPQPAAPAKSSTPAAQPSNAGKTTSPKDEPTEKAKAEAAGDIKDAKTRERARKQKPAKTLEQLNRTLLTLLSTMPGDTAAGAATGIASPAFSVELTLPHPAAQTQLATLTSASPIFTASATTRSRILIGTKTGLPPSCQDWQAFLRDLRTMVWSVHPDSSEARVTAVDASAIATALGGTAAASTASSSPGTSTASATATTSSPAAPSFTVTVAPPPAAATPASGGSTASPAPAPTTITFAAAPPVSAAPATPSSTATASTPNVSVGSIEPDLLLFSDTNPGDDSLITEKKRVAAILDLPRPEMSISAWVMQNSSVDPRTVNESNRLVRSEVAAHNRAMETTVLDGWRYLKAASADPAFFDPAFYNYVARRVLYTASQPAPDSLDASAEAFLEETNASISSLDEPPAGSTGKKRREYMGACGAEEYCLGYTDLFHPIKLRLTDLLLALIAAADTQKAVNCSVDAAEGAASGLSNCQNFLAGLAPVQECKPDDPASPCQIWKSLFPTASGDGRKLPINDPRNISDCERGDYAGALQSMLRSDPAHPQADPHAVMYLNCFRRTASGLLRPTATDADPVSQLGLTRAAIADFLFNYKMSQQYPHEFAPYDLSTSAQAMNSALRPLVDAFLEDVLAYEAVVKRKLGLELGAMNKKLTSGSWFDKPYLLNNAIVTVNTIANSEASVDTATESYLEALNPPSLGGLAGAISGASGTNATAVTGGTPSTTNVTTSALGSLLSSTRYNEAAAIAAGLQQFQSSRIHLGRDLLVDIKPESLMGANSAELQVTLNADDESGSGAYSSGTSSADAEVSRLSKSNTSTRVRVDSLKLFEVSSFASELNTPKKRFPLLPIPGLEMPYFGSLLSVPLRPAREYHASMAVLSATVIPTAADLAYTARFALDRLVAADSETGPKADSSANKGCVWPIDRHSATGKPDPSEHVCKTRPMVSLQDFNGAPIKEFNRMKTHCLATSGYSPSANQIPSGDALSKDVCDKLTFGDVLADRN